MINIIIYEDNSDMQQMYQEIVKHFFNLRKEKIRFHIFSNYAKNLENKFLNIAGKRIYILDIEVPGKSGLDLARTIRKSGDWMSPLMIITSYDHLKNTGFTSKVLMLDFISKREDVEKRLNQSLETAYHMINDRDAYTFQYNGELFHVPFNDILYFEKDLNDNYTFVYTKTNSYKIKECISSIAKKIEYSSIFLKVHRSCIVNVNNIDFLNVKENKIYCGKYVTNFITKENRDLLKKKLPITKVIKC